MEEALLGAAHHGEEAQIIQLLDSGEVDVDACDAVSRVFTV